MVLSDRCIRNEVKQGRIIVEPFDDSCVQPASLDIHLARSFQVFEYWKYPHYIDLRQPLDTLSREVEIDDTDYFSLQPSQFVLGSTMEHITIPNDIMGSWAPSEFPGADAEHSHIGGRLYLTALSVLVLETPFRHAPLYEPPPAESETVETETAAASE